MKNIFRTIIAIVVFIAVIYLVSNYLGPIEQRFGIKNASTDKSNAIQKQISNDVGSWINAGEKQVMQMKVSDIVNGLSRFKRIPQDANGIKNYAQSEYANVLKSREKKK